MAGYETLLGMVATFVVGIVFSLLLVRWSSRRRRQRVEQVPAKIACASLAEIRAAVPPQGATRGCRNFLALAIFSFVAPGLVGLILYELRLCEGWVVVAAMIVIPCGLFMVLLPAGFVVASLVARFRRGRDLLRLGRDPYATASGAAATWGAAATTLAGLVDLALWVFQLRQPTGWSLLLFASLGQLVTAGPSRLTEKGFFVQGFLYPWAKIRWYAWTPDGSFLLFGVRSWMNLGSCGRLWVPKEHREDMRRVVVAALSGKEYQAAAAQAAGQGGTGNPFPQVTSLKD